tara:strand:+ start:103 stop:363 length:261 start_codon:yes stop_codon:yes gene_type:complete
VRVNQSTDPLNPSKLTKDQTNEKFAAEKEHSNTANLRTVIQDKSEVNSTLMKQADISSRIKKVSSPHLENAPASDISVAKINQNAQ